MGTFFLLQELCFIPTLFIVSDCPKNSQNPNFPHTPPGLYGSRFSATFLDCLGEGHSYTWQFISLESN